MTGAIHTSPLPIICAILYRTAYFYHLSTVESYKGTITYDIRFYALVPGTDDRIRLILNVEAQNDFYPGYPLITRGIYYGSRMISAQYGTVFTKSHYEKIQKVYSIWICMNPSEKRQNSIARYSVTEDMLIGTADEAIKNYDLLTVVMICLGKPAEESPGGILRLLDVLFSQEMKLEEKQNIMENEYKIPMSKNLEREVDVMGNLGDSPDCEYRVDCGSAKHGAIGFHSNVGARKASIKVLSENVSV